LWAMDVPLTSPCFTAGLCEYGTGRLTARANRWER